MWTPETRARHNHDHQRYGSDLTDEDWQVLAPLMPPPAKTGRRRVWPMREMMNAIFYLLRGGCPWRLLPEHFPPHQTVYRWFVRFRDDGSWETWNHHLVMLDRERVGREASPSGAVIDSQSVKTTESGGPRGFDAGKKVKGRKRHALVDTDCRLLVAQAHPASVQDRDGAVPLLQASRGSFPFIELVFADTAMPANGSPTPHVSLSKSSTKSPIKSGSSCCHGAGWSRELSLGSTETDVWPRTSRAQSPRRQPSTMPLPSCS